MVLGVENKNPRRGGAVNNYYLVNTDIIVLYQIIMYVSGKIPDVDRIVDDDRHCAPTTVIVDSRTGLPDSASMMFGILAISLPLLVADPRVNQRDDLPYLPDDLCVYFSSVIKAKATDCSKYSAIVTDYTVIVPEADSPATFSLPRVIDDDFAKLLNWAIKSGIVRLKKESPSE